MMHYTPPELVSLTAVNGSRGNCADGSGATDGSPCMVGTSDEAISCASGFGNSDYCNTGTAASPGGVNECHGGNSPTTSCAVGTAPEY